MKPQMMMPLMSAARQSARRAAHALMMLSLCLMRALFDGCRCRHLPRQMACRLSREFTDDAAMILFDTFSY